jgi:purine-binding chemotaxis protein CheW
MSGSKHNQISSYLSFKIGNETYAAGVNKVINILEMTKITKVPQAPDYMKGVINLRENVLPVVDTRLKFGLPEVPPTQSTCIVVLDLAIENENLLLGAIVDSVQEVIEIDQSMIKNPPSLGKKYKSEFITGVLPKDDSFIMILDLDKVFSSDDIVSIREKAEEAWGNNQEADNAEYLDPSEYEGFKIDAKEQEATKE